MQLYNFNSKQSKIFLILLVTNCIVSLPMDLSLLKSHVRPDLSRQGSLVLTRWPRHYAFKDHWSEANLMIIFCPISAGNWLVSIRVTRSDQSEASFELPVANQRRAETESDHHQIWQINRETRMRVLLTWPGALVSAIHLYTRPRVFMGKIQSGIRWHCTMGQLGGPGRSLFFRS